MDQPQEIQTAAQRARVMGAGALSDAELTEVMLGRVPTAGATLRQMQGMRPPELAGALGVSVAAAVRVLCCLEAGRRASIGSVAAGARMANPSDVAAVMAPQLLGLDNERVYALMLNRRHGLISQVLVSEGWQEGAPVDPREVYRSALSERACGVILVHNHPSGDPTPSASDRELTRRLRDAGKCLGVALVDHVVVASGGHASMAAEGLCS